MAQKFFAPWSVRHDPEIFCWSLTILMSRSAWLLSKGTAKSVVNRRPTFGPGRRRWLGEQLGRRWHRRIAGIALETLTQIGHLGSQCGDFRCLGRHYSLQVGHQPDQLVVGRSVRSGIAGWNSPRYARRPCRWGTRPSGDLNSYSRTMGECGSSARPGHSPVLAGVPALGAPMARQTADSGRTPDATVGSGNGSLDDSSTWHCGTAVH